MSRDGDDTGSIRTRLRSAAAEDSIWHARRELGAHRAGGKTLQEKAEQEEPRERDGGA